MLQVTLSLQSRFGLGLQVELGGACFGPCARSCFPALPMNVARHGRTWPEQMAGLIGGRDQASSASSVRSAHQLGQKS